MLDLLKGQTKFEPLVPSNVLGLSFQHCTHRAHPEQREEGLLDTPY